MSKVSVSIGKTYNTGNYQSLRLDVGLEDTTTDAICDEGDLFDSMVEAVKDRLVNLEKDFGVH